MAGGDESWLFDAEVSDRLTADINAGIGGLAIASLNATIVESISTVLTASHAIALVVMHLRNGALGGIS